MREKQFGLVESHVLLVWPLLLVLGGVGYVAAVCSDLAAIATDSIVFRALRMAAATGEIGSALWLLAFGARMPRGAAR